MTYTTPQKTLPQGVATVSVNLLDGGSLQTADISKLHADAEPNSFRLYDWCFLVSHPISGRHILWDVGLSSDRSCYTPLVLDSQWDSANPVGPRKSLRDQLEDHGVGFHQIDTVIFSHAHWDHCRPIREEFPNAIGIFGKGTMAHCSPGHLQDTPAASSVLWDGRFFDTSGHASEKWKELTGEWTQFGPFPKALDYFGDGSFMILEAPGHMPGNLAAASRIDMGEERHAWVLLASDCCHSRELLSRRADIAFFDVPGGKACLHEDIEAAKDTIKRVRQAELQYGMHVAMAHDAEWMREGSDDVLMSILPKKGREGFLQAIEDGKAP